MKGKWKQISVAVVFALVILSIPAYPDATTNAVGVRVEFDKDSYVPGETATVSLLLTGLDDEMPDSLCMGSFETHLQFDPARLAFDSGSFSPPLLQAAQGEADPMVLLGLADPDRYPGVIVTALESPDGFLLEGIAENGVLQVATLMFTVIGSANTDVSAAFAPAYQTVVARLPGADAEFAIESETADTAQIVPAKLLLPDAQYDASASAVTGSVTCVLPDGASAVVLAALYHKTDAQRLQAAPQIFSVAAEGGDVMTRVIEPRFPDIKTADGYEIRYYLWQAGDSIEPVVPHVLADVTP